MLDDTEINNIITYYCNGRYNKKLECRFSD
jgi:hypothetical protein